MQEIIDQFIPNMRFQPAAMEALQAISEWYVTDLFEDANIIAIHANF
jgi:histone H3/H4